MKIDPFCQFISINWQLFAEAGVLARVV